ncbi:Uncharacterised protein [Vibrio cholerae]|nr:Uncharacterised protein [Vibrio cholerae]
MTKVISALGKNFLASTKKGRTMTWSPSAA